MTSLVLSDCVERFLSWCRANRRPKTVEHYRYQLGRWVEAAPGLTLDRLTPALVTSLFRARHPIQALLRLCNWCHRDERTLTVNPLHGFKKPRGGARHRVLSRADVVRLLRGADRTFRQLLLVLRETMCRPQEARALRWADIESNRGGGADRGLAGRGDHWFHLPTAKGFELRADQGGERVLPISPRLGRLLGRLARKGVTLGEPILRDSKGRAWTNNAVRCRFRRLRVRLGFAADRRGERIVAYTLRHTGATNAVSAGVRDFLLAGLLGHASTRTTARYVHLRPADLVEGMKRVWERKPADAAKKDRPGLRRNASD